MFLFIYLFCFFFFLRNGVCTARYFIIISLVLESIFIITAVSARANESIAIYMHKYIHINKKCIFADTYTTSRLIFTGFHINQ